MDGRSDVLLGRGRLACHCLLIETDNTLVLIDTGLGMQDVRDPRARLSRFFLALLDPDFRDDMTAVRQIERLGFNARDVRQIVLTHLDFDHAGGLDDFPEATVHLLQSERDYAAEQKTWLDRQRFRPRQWSSRPKWQVYRPGEGDAWFGFNAVRQLEGLPPEIALIPLVGHTFGHTGVAIDTGGGWLLQAGDAYFYHQEMNVEDPYCTPGLRFYQAMMDKNRRARKWNQRRLRELKRDHGGEVEILCSHDPHEFERVAGRPLSEPAERRHPHAVRGHREITHGEDARQ